MNSWNMLIKLNMLFTNQKGTENTNLCLNETSLERVQIFGIIDDKLKQKTHIKSRDMNI